MTKKTKWDVEETRESALPLRLQFEEHGFSTELTFKVPHHLYFGTEVYVVFWGDLVQTTTLVPRWYIVRGSTIDVSKDKGYIRTVRLVRLPPILMKHPDRFKYPLLMVRTPDYRLVD